MVKVEPILILLAVMIIVFTGCLFVCEHFYPNDGQIFQVVSNLLSGFAGAFLIRVKPASKPGDDPVIPPPGATITSQHSDTTTASTESK